MQAELIINNICNLSCKHCFQGNTKLVGTPLSVIEWVETIRKLAPYVDHYHFAGKEPLLDSKIFSLIYFIPSDKTFSLVTNGVNIPTYIRYLAPTQYPNLTDVGVSIDSFMGDESVRPFQEINNIKMLTDLGVHVTAYLTLTSLNYKNLIPNIQKLQEVGVNDFWIIPVLALGKTPKELILSPLQLIETLRFLEHEVLWGNFTVDVKGGYAEAIKSEKFDFITNVHLRVEFSCEKFVNRIVITPDGEVLGCGFEYSDGYDRRSSGNIVLDDVEELLEAGDRSRERNREFATVCKENNQCSYCRDLCPLMNFCYKDGVEM